ncbi:hypothetical protein DSCO28_68730 [Desulfosarcina ovata subsp. sediminis]|uniref:Cytidylate kinase n=1 Tax=Desulfosarcina ovata subsp. sediminis TaxID=885957 RepID=A0A5K8A1F7_9BACT|nr:cytidylate kinase family protein [Desulfosarcina ovata]BBO86307.1 hypothetical protein DSCO28_68730 [Desulfosarcina ovata subsp. sediminis]
MTTHLCINGEAFARTQKIVDWIASRTGWPIVSDRDLIEAAGQRFNISADRLERCMRASGGVLNRLTHGAERSVAYLKSVLADKLAQEPVIFHGFMGLLLPRENSPVMTVLVTADTDFRLQRALHAAPMDKRQAKKMIDRRDRTKFSCYRNVVDGQRFDAHTYDTVVPSDRMNAESAGRLILEQLVQFEMRAQTNTAGVLDDLKLASQVEVSLCERGYHVSATAEKGRVRLTVNQPVLFLKRLARKLERQVRRIEGVRQVETKPGPNFFQADVYRRCRFEVPAELAFRSFARCRQRLHDQAADQFPELSPRQVRSEQRPAIQLL